MLFYSYEKIPWNIIKKYIFTVKKSFNISVGNK